MMNNIEKTDETGGIAKTSKELVTQMMNNIEKTDETGGIAKTSKELVTQMMNNIEKTDETGGIAETSTELVSQMMNNIEKTDEIGGIAETSTELVSQLSPNVSTTAAEDSVSGITSKESEFQNGGSGEATDTINSLSNDSSVTPSKETNKLKCDVVEEVEEVKPIIPKVDHSESSNGTKTNSENGNLSHHNTALPYVVPSKESSPVSNQNDLPKSPQTSDTIPVEEKKSPQTRVLRASKRCRSDASSLDTFPIVPDEQSTQTTIHTSSELTATTALSGVKLHPKRRKLKASRFESKTTDTPVNMNVIGDDTKATTSTTTSKSNKTAELSGSEVQLHPKRRKLRGIHNKSKTTNVTAVETNPSSTKSEYGPFTNYYQMFLNIRKQVDKRRKNLFSVQPKPPSGFEDNLMNKRTYILDGTYKSRVLNAQIPPPTNLHQQLKKLFVEQEKERQKLRLQHIVEKEKLVLCVEQEIVRVHGRAARALANQPMPFSVCTMLMDEEVYNIMTPEQEKEKNEKSRSRYNGRIFLSWLQEIDDKWEKIKVSLLLRHHNEAESLHAVQKMNWGWKLKQLQLCTYSSSEPNIDDEHVPMVLVSDDFDHFPS